MASNLASATFTNKRDIVTGGFLYQIGGTINALDGNDKIIGTSTDLDAVYRSQGQIIYGVGLKGGSLNLQEGEDSIEGYASSDITSLRVYGIGVRGNTLDTGNSNDKVIGISKTTADTAYGHGIIVTEDGGKILTGNGNDQVRGKATGTCRNPVPNVSDPQRIAGIFVYNFLQNTINTGAGNDRVIGIGNNTGPYGEVAGIYLQAGSRIETRGGDDVVTGRAIRQGTRVNGFSGGGLISLGAGNDRLDGFGYIEAKGGKGNDTWILSGYSSKDFTIAKTNPTSAKGATFRLDGVTATIEGFEAFVFDNGTFSYAQLT